jgi:hypothetical protein
MNGDNRLRAELTDLQRQGIEAVSDVFERLFDQTQHARSGPGTGDPVTTLQIRAAVARTVDAFADLFQRTFDLYADLLADGAASRGATDRTPDGSIIELSAPPGAEAEGCVWIHNSTGGPVRGVTLRMTGLTAHDGAAVAATAGTFAPPELDVPAGASGSSRLSVRIPATASAGIYHGHVLAAGLAGVSLPVRLVVEP